MDLNIERSDVVIITIMMYDIYKFNYYIVTYSN